MAPRANWKGYLKLSLVSCAVELYPSSTTKDRVTFNMVNRETGNRLRRQLVDEVTGDLVEGDQQVKGYEIAKRDYVILEDDEIESVAIESTHTIDIESFVPRAEIDEALHRRAPDRRSVAPQPPVPSPAALPDVLCRRPARMALVGVRCRSLPALVRRSGSHAPRNDDASGYAHLLAQLLSVQPLGRRPAPTTIC